ncbi:response regulator transcription factor [Paenibacillus eucommiae]|uniref:YesN/AraC family two-component response regulator n=1 Tax=Paenibacillus eucommiae TaxID=1355755 RepID=A0ABS4IS52_9BACL|nr:response regulator [Paenibacillus eucommiae]MBP1990402.1 YesN/AraC family two-component response regulator [Paenibacillus eucommiae]
MHKLLIVDDEEYVRNGLKKRFSWQEFGFQVIGTCNNGQEALDFVRTNQTHVVLTDIKMPGMGGLELAAQIHQLFPEIHIILLSAYNDFKFAQEAIKLGVKGYLLKPVEEDEVKELFASISKSLRLAARPNYIPPAPADLSSYNSMEKQCITRAKQFVEEHIESKITLQEVARELHFTATYFSIFFKKETNQNFIDYVTEVKIKKAMQLLQYSDFLVKDIAYKVGYDDYSYFCKIFRKYVGTTPLDYRTNRMK